MNRGFSVLNIRAQHTAVEGNAAVAAFNDPDIEVDCLVRRAWRVKHHALAQKKYHADQRDIEII